MFAQPYSSGRLPPNRPDLRHFGNQFLGEGRVFEMFVDDGNHAVVDESPNGIANHALFIAQQIVDSI